MPRWPAVRNADPSCWRPEWAELETFACVEAFSIAESRGLQSLEGSRGDRSSPLTLLREILGAA